MQNSEQKTAARAFTKVEAIAFLSGSFPTESGWKVDATKGTVNFYAYHIDRDHFDEQLQWYAHDKDIQLDYCAFVYKFKPVADSPIEMLTVEIPYWGE